MGKREQSLLASEVAKLYYLEHKTQEEIGQKLGYSRTKVARLLKVADDEKLVEIYVRDAGDPVEEDINQLEEKLASQLGLEKEYTKVLPTFSTGEILIEKLGRKGAEVLEKLVFQVHSKRKKVKLGISFGTQLRYVVNYSYPKQVCEDLHVIPLIGGLGPGEEFLRNESNELARRIAKHYRGTWYHLLAPAKVTSQNAKGIIEREKIISDVMSDALSADIYLVGIGETSASSTKVAAGLISRQKLEELVKSKKVVGSICAQMFTSDGECCPYPEGVIVGISLDDLKKSIKKGSYVLAVAGGEARYKAILGALNAGFINCLVTDQRCAKWILEHSKANGEPSIGEAKVR